MKFHNPFQVSPLYVPKLLVEVEDSVAPLGGGNVQCQPSIFEDTADVTPIYNKFSFFNL